MLLAGTGGGSFLEPDHLLRYHHDSLCRKSSVTVIKQVFKRRSEEIDDEDIVEAFLAEVIDIRNTRYPVSVAARVEADSQLTAPDKDFVCPVLIS